MATVLFAEMERSAGRSEHLATRYADVLADYRRLLRVAVHAQDGQEIGPCADGCVFVFARAKEGLSAAVAALRATHRYPWPADISAPGRMGLHSGQLTQGDTGRGAVDVRQAAYVCAAGHPGQILLSEATCDLVADNLPKGISLRDLGRHRLGDLGEPQAIFQVTAAGLPADFPPLNSLSLLPNNLPRQATSFIGREREMIEVKRLLSATSLLTLTGTGGSGKTRLALQVAASVLASYPDGVWLVDLASLSDPALVPQTVASALTVPERPGRSLSDTLVDYLRPKSLLVILDNCEHVLTASAQLAGTILRSCPGLRLFATSREPLRVGGEVSWRVPSLSVPDPGHSPAPERLMDYEAVQLFVERAKAAVPAFKVTTQNGQALARTCHRVDGIPLAIELAAARVKVLNVEQIVTRLDDRFRLLTRGDRTAPPRQQTLRAMMDWSYALASEQERTLLRRLSVFSGGWTLEAAEAVCAYSGVQAADVLNLLAELVEKSLVVMEPSDTAARYRLLETVRQYGQEKLSESGEAAAIRTCHLDFFLALAEEAAPGMENAAQAVSTNRLDADHDNLRGGLAWSLENDGTKGLRLASALWRFWTARGHFTEGRRWLKATLERARAGSPALRAKALQAAGSLAAAQNDYVEARTFCEDSLVLYRTIGDKRGAAVVIAEIGSALRKQGDYKAARPYLEGSLAAYRELEDRPGIAALLAQLGHDFWHEAKYAKARALLEESLSISRDLGLKRTTAFVLWSLGLVAFDRRDNENARALYEEGLSIAKELGDTSWEVRLVESIAGLAAAEGQPRRAALLLGASEALREAIDYPLPPSHRHDYERPVAAIRAALDAGAFTAAWTEGRATPFEQTVEYALARSGEAGASSPATGTPGGLREAALLSPREREVAALVARGLSNPEIASRLVITLRTAQTHVQNILNKLGMTSRAQIAAWAVEHGLYNPGATRR